MSGLPSGQFVDYLIIGAITSVCGAVLDHVLKSMDSKKSLRITTMLLLVSAAMWVGYMRTRYLERAELQVQKDDAKSEAKEKQLKDLSEKKSIPIADLLNTPGENNDNAHSLYHSYQAATRPR